MNSSSRHSNLIHQQAGRSVCGSWLVALLLLLALPAVLQAQFTFTTNSGTITITGYTGPGGAVTLPSAINGLPVTCIAQYAFAHSDLSSLTIPETVTDIGSNAFYDSGNLTNVIILGRITTIQTDTFRDCFFLNSVTIPNSVTTINDAAFFDDEYLRSITIPDSVTYLGSACFWGCNSLGSVTIGHGVTTIRAVTFFECFSLTTVTIPNSVTQIEGDAFGDCFNLTEVLFEGNAPSIFGELGTGFPDSPNATAYYLPGTTGWGPTFSGLPTALWPPSTIDTLPLSQTAEVGSAVGWRVKASGAAPLSYLWYFGNANLLSRGTNCEMELTNVQFAQSGAYTVVVTNAAGAITSSPAMLQVIAPVERRTVPGVQVTGAAGSLLNLDSANSLSPVPNWTLLGSASLTKTSQYYFDLTLPLPAQRFYRAWQTGAPGVVPYLDLYMVPAITLTGSVGRSVRVDYINRFGPTDAWVTLDTATLTNTSQLYFDVSAPGQPQRFYRLVQLP
jgi:hypothetical protein